MLVATKPFSYGTRALKVGQEFVAKSAREQRLLIAIGRARWVDQVVTPESKAAPEPEPAPEPTPEVEQKPEPEPAPAPEPEQEQKPAPVKALTSNTETAKKPGRPKKDT